MRIRALTKKTDERMAPVKALRKAGETATAERVTPLPRNGVVPSST